MKTSRPIPAFLLGLAAAGVILAVHLAGWDKNAELHALNMRFKYGPGQPRPENIVHIDIDDNSLNELGRWPWPRDVLAGIIESLSQCDARMIVLDIILPEPQKIRYVDAAGEVYSGDMSPLVAEAPPVPVFDDAILLKAMQQSRCVFLPMHIDFYPTGKAPPPEPLNTAIANILTSSKPLALSWVCKKLSASLQLDELAVTKAYLNQRGVLAVQKFALPENAIADSISIPAGKLVPPLVLFVPAIRGCGFVTFAPDIDGITRRIQLLGRNNDKVYPQFAMAVAASALGLEHGGTCSITADDSSLTLTAPDGWKRIIPLDNGANMLINWTPSLWLDEAGKLGDNHIGAREVAAIAQAKKRIMECDALMQALRVQFIGMGFGEDVGMGGEIQTLMQLTQQQDNLYRRRINLQRQRLRAMLFDPADIPAAKTLLETHQAELAVEKQLFELSAKLVAQLRRPEVMKKFLRVPQSKAMAVLQQLDALPQKRSEAIAKAKTLTQRLSRKVAGKICVIGSTATGAADFVATPIAALTPGVVMHTNIINTILTGRFISESPKWLNILVILTAGAGIAFLAATRPVLQAALALVVAAAGYTVLNGYVLFGLSRYWLVLMSPLGAMIAAFGVVSAFRQLTEERARREIRKMFAHALSPTLVDRLLEDPSLAELGGQNRDISCLFSDLRGFTELSGRLGPQKTVHLLRRYFDCVTSVVQQRWGGYLNKFLGDGVFAFFGVPVEQPDHPNLSVQAAVDYETQVAKLNNTLTDEFERDVLLSVRIGIATNRAMVGNCGSSERMDYTAIGDCVNLASRLESVNKFFGTCILIEQSTWLRCEQANFLARPLGAMEIAGVARPVHVWNILGRRKSTADDADAEKHLADLANKFSQAMEALQNRQFDIACELLEQLADKFPTDVPTKTYLNLCRQCLALPIADNFQPPPINSHGLVRIIWPGAQIPS